MGTYLRNIAMSLIGQLGITPAELHESCDEGHHFCGAQVLYERRNVDVRKRLCTMRHGTLGKIAAQGKGDPMYLVHCGSWLGKDWDGLSLLLEVACTAIIAEMTAILRARDTTEKPAATLVPAP